MAVPIKQSVQITFAGSIDTKTDPRQVSPANFLALNNMVFTVGGQLTKRNGFPGLGTAINTPNPALTFSTVGGTLTSARKVFSYQNELCVNDPFNLYSYDEANNGWNYKGRSTIVSVGTTNIAQDVNNKINMDMSINATSGVKIFAWQEASNVVRFSIQDILTGQFIVNKILFGATYMNPRCVSISGQSYILAINTSDGKLYYQSIVGQTVTGSPTILVSDLNATNQFYDFDVISGNIYLTYVTSAPATKIALLNSSLAVTASITKAGEHPTNGLSMFGDGSNIWVVYNNGSVKAFIVNNAVTATIAAPTTLDSGGTAAPGVNITGCWSSLFNTAFIFYDVITEITLSTYFLPTTNFTTATLSGSTITPGTALQFMRSVNIISKAFTVSGIPHLVTVFSDNLPFLLFGVQQAFFLLNIYNVTNDMTMLVNNTDIIANIAAKVAPGAAGTTVEVGSSQATTTGYMSGVHNSSGSIWEMALSQKTNITSATSQSTVYSPNGVIDCQFDFSLSNPDVQVLANNAHIARGQLTMYDAANVVEQNFHVFPEGMTAVVSTSGGHMGSASADTLYGYKVTYEWVDNQGQTHRSSPSPNFTPFTSGQIYTFVSGTTTGKVTLTIPTLKVTNKGGSAVNICVYRTVANGSVYFLTPSGTVSVLNNPSVDTITYEDTLSDTLLTLNNQIYTTGELEDFAPPAPKTLTTFKNRLLQVPSEGGYDFYYSKQVLTGFPVEFVPEFDQNIGTVAGPLTTIAGMDDKIILFKSGLSSGPSILYMVGTGPAASGANNDFTDPLPVAVDCGCVDRASVVLTPNGLMFKADKGIYLLDRSLQASYLGAPVEFYNQYSVLSAQLIPNSTQVRFLLSNGIYLMFDYFYNRFGTFSNPAGISDCIFQGQHTYVDASGQVYKEAPGQYFDGTNTPVLMNFTTSWIKLAGLQGYQRAFFFYFLAEYLSAHKLSFSISYDFSSNPAQTTVITPNSSMSLENWRIFLAKQRCQAFQISMQEIYTGTLGAALTMSGLNLLVGAKSSFRTISAAETAG